MKNLKNITSKTFLYLYSFKEHLINHKKKAGLYIAAPLVIIFALFSFLHFHNKVNSEKNSDSLIAASQALTAAKDISEKQITDLLGTIKNSELKALFIFQVLEKNYFDKDFAAALLNDLLADRGLNNYIYNIVVLKKYALTNKSSTFSLPRKIAAQSVFYPIYKEMEAQGFLNNGDVNKYYESIISLHKLPRLPSNMNNRLQEIKYIMQYEVEKNLLEKKNDLLLKN